MLLIDGESIRLGALDGGQQWTMVGGMVLVDMDRMGRLCRDLPSILSQPI